MPFLMQSDPFGMILWFMMFFVFIFLYPRLMLSQLIYKIEQSARKMEDMSRKANIMVTKKITSAPEKELRNEVNAFTDFFVIEPSNIDPYGLVKKIDQTIRSMEDRFSEFVNKVAKGSEKERQQINYGLRAAIGLRQIAKIVRHNVELAKKFKNLQIAMILQMQMPIIEKLAESEFKGTESFLRGWPIGDSIGPLVASSYIEKEKPIAEDVVYDKVKIKNRVCFVLRAAGPEPKLGRMDEAIEKIMSKNKIARVVTIDAAQKLEGEKTGSVAEGVGFAMGGIGQREIIENVLLPKKKPMDSIVVKVGMMEAIVPMKKEIYKAVPAARKLVEQAVERAKKNEKVIIIGVGNSSGIPNNKKSLDGIKKIVDAFDKKYKKEEEEKKGSWF